MAIKKMVRCVRRNRYGNTEGCGGIETTDRWTAKTRQWVMRNYAMSEANAKTAVPDLSESTPKAFIYVCPLCCQNRNMTNNDLEIVGEGEINTPTIR